MVIHGVTWEEALTLCAPLASAEPSISGEEWAPVGVWGTYLSVEISSNIESTNESSFGKGIDRNLTATLKKRYTPGVPQLHSSFSIMVP